MERDIEKYARVTEILGIFQAYAFVDKKKLKKAQDIGTVIHAAIEEYFKDGFTPLDRIKGPYFDSFLRWVEGFKPRVIATETRLFDDHSMITGQFDLLAEIDGLRYIVDFKTGGWAHPEIWNLQMHFYKYLLDINYLWTTNKFMIVQLKKDGEHPEIFNFDWDMKVQAACENVYECYRYFNGSLT